MFMLDDATAQFAAHFTTSHTDIGSYTDMKWPHFIPLMHLHAEQYASDQYGTLMTLSTRAAGGMMQIETAVFTPAAGINMPLLLIDAALTKKKSIVFVEYYDCTTETSEQPLLEETAEQFKSLRNYAEKPAWYIQERTPYSLIKYGLPAEAAALKKMACTSITSYLDAAKNAACVPLSDNTRIKNRNELREFQERMVVEGNPSSSVLNSVLGKKKAEDFFRTIIMPVP